MKEKVAITVTRYGKDINGGAELHCRMLAERLVPDYDVEILTTCIKDYVTGEAGYAEGVEEDGGVTVRRFATVPYDRAAEKKWLSKVRLSRRIRRLLYWCGCLRFVAGQSPVWKWGLEADINAVKSGIFYSPDMIRYIEEHKGGYKAILSLTATYAPFFMTAMHAGEKMIGIPTLHPERAAFRPSLTLSFTKAAYIGFNTAAEQELAWDIFGKGNIRGGIISTGIEDAPADNWEKVKKQFSLPDRYVVFIGRIEKGKAGKLVRYYSRYAASHPDAPKLVMVGGLVKEVGRHKDMIFTGFTSEGAKRAILQHALLLVNPSKYESLSLVVLEALRDRVPVLVNGKCEVLRQHCVLSGNAVRSFRSYREFCREFREATENASARKEMIEKGEKYYLENYSWDRIMPRLHKAIAGM